ncbi:MAG: hypothetical protein HQ528_05635, partial [Candidatus Marinimicrobia bacterium]|nr:hypothetical protein [Candidatus Neomarinimicrobiota bacterium]
FEPNDIGFNREADNTSLFIWAQYREDSPSDHYQRWSVNFNSWQGGSFGTESPHYGGNVNGSITLKNYWHLGGGLNIGGPSWHRYALWGGPSLRMDPNMNSWLNINSDSRKNITINFNGYYGGQITGSRFYGLSPNMTWRPTNNFSMRMYLSYRGLDDNWSTWSDYDVILNEQDPDSTGDFLMSDIIQNTLSATLRLDFTLTPTLSIQFYGSPYVTAGKYFNFKRVADAHASEWDQRYEEYENGEITYNAENEQWMIDSDLDGVNNYTIDNYDFNYKQFNSNLVIRWEYLPGSTFYLVWSNGLSDFLEGNNEGEMNFSEDVKNMVKLDAENIVMMKVSYLLNI